MADSMRTLEVVAVQRKISQNNTIKSFYSRTANNVPYLINSVLNNELRMATNESVLELVELKCPKDKFHNAYT